MKRRFKIYLGLFLALISLLNYSQAISAWDGVELNEPSKVDEVYQINNASELKWFQTQVNSGNNAISAKLVNDIDLENNAWTAIGTTTNTFKGIFDGDNHKITNFYLSSVSTFQGLFGKSEGNIKNVVLYGEMIINGNKAGNASLVGWNAGGIINNNMSYVKISNTGTSGAVIGGIVGQNSVNGIISNNTFSGKIDGFSDAGGAKNVGGIVGYNLNDNSSKIYGNINTGSIVGAKIAAQSQVGGIVGLWAQTGSSTIKTYIYNNINYGNISAESTNSYVGGIIGQVTGKSSANTDKYYLFNNLNLGAISGIVSRTGSIVGYTNSSGDLYNKDNYIFVNNYYLANETNEATNAYTSADIKKASFIEKLNSNTGSDYDINVSEELKYVSVNDDYPSLKWNEKEELDTSVEDLAYLNKALADLDKSWYVATFKPKFGYDTNIVTLMENKLASLGYSDIDVSIKESDKTYIANDGTISYFYKDPNSSASMWFASSKVIYELSKNTQSVDTSINAVIHWDRDKLREKMQLDIVDELDANLIKGENIDLDNVESDLSLAKYINNKRWAVVDWTSFDEDIIKVISPSGNLDNQLYGPYIGKIKQSNKEQTITLTARIKNNYIQTLDPLNEDLIIEKTFTIKIKPVGEKLLQEMQEQLNTNYTIEKLSDSITKEKINPDKVINDIQFLTPSKTGIKDYNNYKFSVTSKDEDLLKINSYRGVVYRPLPMQESKKVKFSITMKHKEFNLEVSKDFEITIYPLKQNEIDNEIKLMNDVKENYFNGLNNGANISKDQIKNKLSTFQEVHYDESNNLVWSRRYDDNKNYGIEPVAIDLSHPSEQWNLYKSSNDKVIAHESLNLANKPSVDTKVTIESVLSSKTFEKYALKYPDNEDFKKLYRQPVSVDVIVVAESKPIEEQLKTYKTTTNGNKTYYYKLNKYKKYDLYKKVEKTNTKTITSNYRTTGSKNISSKDILTKKSGKTIQKANYKYNTNKKLTSSKIQKLYKNKFITTYYNTKTYYKNAKTIKTSKSKYKNSHNKYTIIKARTYTSKGKKAKLVVIKYKNGLKKTRYEYTYYSKGKVVKYKIRNYR